jgi:hypothetical protein
LQTSCWSLIPRQAHQPPVVEVQLSGQATQNFWRWFFDQASLELLEVGGRDLCPARNVP